MISERFPVGAGADRMAAIHTITQNFAWQNWLDKKNALRLMLLVEETIGMMNAMVEDYRGEMWLSYEDRICRINLEAECGKGEFEAWEPRMGGADDERKG